MPIEFRPLPARPDEPAALGELHLRPAAPYFPQHAELALLVLEHGPAALVRGGEGPWPTVVIQSAPTLDDMVALLILQQLPPERPLPGGAPRGARVLAHATAALRQGVRPWPEVPIPVSLDAVFAAIRTSAGPNLAEPEACRKFLRGWDRLAAVLAPVLTSPFAPDWRTLLPPEEFALERELLRTDREVYDRDVARGQRWRMRLPGHPAVEPALLLHQPRSSLFQVWARADPKAEGGRGYRFLAVCWGQGQWDFSTDPRDQLRIDSLAGLLQDAERQANPEADADPWYDGKRFNGTLVSAPRRGTRLEDAQVLDIVYRWGQVRRIPLPRLGLLRIGATLAGLLLALAAGYAVPRVASSAAPHPAPEGKTFPPEVMAELRSRAPVMDAGEKFVLQPGGRQTLSYTLSNKEGATKGAQLWLRLPIKGPKPEVAVRVQLPGKEPAELELGPVKGGRVLSAGYETEPYLCTLPAGDTTLRVTVENRQPGRPLTLTVDLYWQLDTEPTAKRTTINLHVLAIGVAHYQNADGSRLVNLDAAPEDVRQLRSAFERLQGRLFNEVTTYPPLLDEGATAEAIRDQLGKFANDVNKDTAKQKLAVLYLAGHGSQAEKVKEFFVFWPYDYDAKRSNTQLYWDEMYARLKQIEGPVLVILDTCHSGQAGEQLRAARARPGEVSLPPGILVLASSDADAKSYEGQSSFLAQAVLEVLTGTAQGVPGTGSVVSVQDLFEYTRRRVFARAKSHSLLQVPRLYGEQYTNPTQIPIAYRPGRRD